MPPSDDDIAAVLMDLAHQRGVTKTFCPSEAARALDAEAWRILMPEIRRVAADFPITATQQGRRVDPRSARGPIRLALSDR